jgi:hypothetical protein
MLWTSPTADLDRIPNNDEGWGRINLLNLVVTNLDTAPRAFEFVDQSVLLTNGQVYEQHAFVQNSDQAVENHARLHGCGGFSRSHPGLVNDLDLEVVGRTGAVYRGNQFSAGESVPNTPSHDDLNNVEAVHLAQPLLGRLPDSRCRARNVVEDARLETASIDQDFAVVISANLARPGVGLVILDRTNYTAPKRYSNASVGHRQASSSSVTVLVKSSTEPSWRKPDAQSRRDLRCIYWSCCHRGRPGNDRWHTRNTQRRFHRSGLCGCFRREANGNRHGPVGAACDYGGLIEH